MCGVLALGGHLHLVPIIGGEVEDNTDEGFKVAGAVVARDGFGCPGDGVDDAEPA